MTYDTGGNLASKTDFNERKTCLTTDPVRELETSRVSGLGKSTTCPKTSTTPIPTNVRRISTQWHPEWKLETAVAGPKLIARYVYNGQRDANGNVASCAENATLPNGKPIAVLCAKTLQATNDANGSLGFDARPEGKPRTWSFTYNARGQLLTQAGPKDALGQSESVTNVYYDDSSVNHSRGDLAKTVNGAGEVTQILEYTKNGIPTLIKHPSGATTSLVYGPRQRLISSTVADGNGGTETTEFAYDDVGQITRIVPSDKSSISYSYDDAHRLTGLTDSQGNRVNLTLDGMGNVVRKEVRDAVGSLVRETTREFDALNRIMREQGEVKSPKGAYLYDRSGNLTAQMNGRGAISHREFDNLNRPKKESLPASEQGLTSGAVAYEYDQQDRLIGVIDPKQLATKYTRDGYGQRTETKSPDTGFAQFAFDGAGNLVSMRDSRGFTTPLLYDAARRVTKIGTSTFEYGKAGSAATGKLSSLTDESGQTRFEYDGYGRLTTKVQTVRTGTQTRTLAIAFEYGKTGNGTGHVTSLTYPSGNRITFDYGPDGQVSSLQFFRANSVEPMSIASAVKYAPWGAVQSWTWGNGTEYRRTFDTVGRITQYPLGHVGLGGTVRTLVYDNAGRIASMKHTGTPQAASLDQIFTYDNQNRLTRVEAAGVSQSFDYDENGNRIRARFGTTTYFNTVSATSNRLLATTGPAPSHVNMYDSAGNLTSDGNVKYTYGANGRMTMAENAGIRTEYKYNGVGQRVLKAAAGSDQTYFMYDADGRIIGEYDADGKAIQETIFLTDIPIAVFKPSAVTTDPVRTPSDELYHVFSDHIGTPRVITSATNKVVVWRWENVDPFGLQQPDERPGSGSRFVYNSRFPGQTFDKETSTHYNYFRNYVPQIGRYIESDPIGLQGGINTYSYVNGNPVTGFDPFGLDDWGRVGRGALVYTHMDEGYTVMYDQETKEFLSDIPTSNKITSDSLPGAGLPYSGAISNDCEIGRLNKAYGSAKVRTGDPRARWVHGGGTGLADSYAPQQGWVPTYGCTRAQNEDVLSLCEAIAKYRKEHPGKNIPYRRD
jgi:RHS repeat-associated protein